MNVQMRRRLRVDRVEKLQQLGTPMPAVHFADDPTQLHVPKFSVPEILLSCNELVVFDCAAPRFLIARSNRVGNRRPTL